MEDEGRWLPLLTPEVAGIADAAAFATWRSQVATLVRLGQLEVHAAAGAVLLVQANGGHRQVLLGAGALDDAKLGDLFDAVAAHATAVSWAAEVGPDWAERLAPQGCQPLVRRHYAIRLGRVAALREPAGPDPAIVGWDEGFRGEAAALTAAACQGTLAGLMLVQPTAPTRAALAAYVDALAGPGGALMAEASSVYLQDGRVAGLLLIARAAEGPLVQVLVVHPAARGQGAARRLLRRTQRVLLAAGEADLFFWTTDDNTPVHRLNLPSELDELATLAGGYWLRPVPAG